MNRRLFILFSVLLSLSFFEAAATHIVGGEFTYKYLGDTVIGSIVVNKYEVSLSIYEDCINGQAEAIAQDNPAFFGVFDAITGNTIELDTVNDPSSPLAIDFVSAVSVPANFSNACVSNIPPLCLIKKTFVKTYWLPSSTSGYVIAYQRCCRNGAIVNINDPGNTGSTYYCTIPSTLKAVNNNSAVFKNYPPQVICLNNPLYYDNSATDVDEDSLSYGFASALLCITASGISKPYPLPPPYGNVSYISPYSDTYPVSSYPPMHINPVTGIITGTPNAVGRYLVAVYCNEYRHGILINTIQREFQFVVTSCTKVVVADIPQYSTDPNTYIVDCSNYTVKFVNTSKGGFSYHWDFGVPGATNDTSDEFEPSFTYPDTGTYTVKLIVNPASTCPDSITRLVKVYPYFRANFSDSGKECPGLPVAFKDLSSATIKPVDYWLWSFGDGDTSVAENPTHSFKYGGIYNVVLVSANIKNCVDTIIKQVVIDNFNPFAGNDTAIVKGASVQFDATGGIRYAWSPGTNLNDTSIYDPLGYYPDTGTFTYYVYVVTELGCSGYDTIKVSVINEAEFFVPTAFTPNGDGKNDLFRPVAVGYRSLNYFRVFNRWGQIVYNNTALDAGWDGTYNNEKADIGTYYWEMSFVDRFGKQSFLKGDVTLIR